MRSIVKVAVFLVGSCAAGLVSAQQLIDGKAGLFTQTTGAWKTWVAAGTRNSDPYTRARFLTAGKLAVSRFEAIEFEARNDDEGRQLQARCSYTLSGRMPSSRWWSLSGHESTSSAVTEATSGGLLTSLDAIYDQDNRLKVAVAQDPQAGNWLVPPGSGSFVLVLRLYNPYYPAGQDRYAGALFDIKRETCR